MFLSLHFVSHRYRVVIAFETIEDFDVAFFVLFVHEHIYEDRSKATTEIDYIDSVRLFEPDEYRTKVYQEILLGYFDHIREIG